MNDVEESEGLPSLDKPGWYSQGNWPHLHELLKTMTGKPEPTVGLIPHTSCDTEHRGKKTVILWLECNGDSRLHVPDCSVEETRKCH